MELMAGQASVAAALSGSLKRVLGPLVPVRAAERLEQLVCTPRIHGAALRHHWIIKYG